MTTTDEPRGAIIATFDDGGHLKMDTGGKIKGSDLIALADAALTTFVEGADPACDCPACAAARAAHAALAPLRPERLAPADARPH